MTILSWHDQYLIGERSIDEQHKQLFKLVNEFHSHWVLLHDPKEIVTVLNQLIQYGEYHFATEEAIMAKEGYPKLEHHQEDHEKLVKIVFLLNEEFAEKHELAANDVQKFCKHWLVDHIIYADYEFRDFLAQKRQQRVDS